MLFSRLLIATLVAFSESAPIKKTGSVPAHVQPTCKDTKTCLDTQTCCNPTEVKSYLEKLNSQKTKSASISDATKKHSTTTSSSSSHETNDSSEFSSDDSIIPTSGSTNVIDCNEADSSNSNTNIITYCKEFKNYQLEMANWQATFNSTGQVPWDYFTKKQSETTLISSVVSSGSSSSLSSSGTPSPSSTY